MFDRCHPRLITEVQMRMSGQMMPKRGFLEFLARISPDEVRCHSLLVMAITYSSIDGKHISFPMLYYDYSWIQMPRCIR